MRLRGISKKGKQRIQQHGEEWTLKLAHDGGEILIRSVEGNDLRWIHPTNDKDFEVIG